jgi:predicted acetyltransferase
MISAGPNALALVRPAREHLAEYEAALRRDWSPDNGRLLVATAEQLAAIETDPDAFLASLDDPEARGAPIPLPDGSTAPRLPSFRRWMWDDRGFAGSIGFRWQNGTPALPPHVRGHVGYAVVPWRRREGIATRAVALLLAEIRPCGLPYVELITDSTNTASQRVIQANGGVLVERFRTDAPGGSEGLRWRIALGG